MLPWAHEHMRPALASGDDARGERRHQAGVDGRRLAAAGGPDDAEEAGADEPRHQLGDDALPPEEIVGVGDLEGGEALERTDDGLHLLLRVQEFLITRALKVDD